MNEPKVALPAVIAPLANLTSDAHRMEYQKGNGGSEVVYCSTFKQINGFCIMEDVKIPKLVFRKVAIEPTFYYHYYNNIGRKYGPCFEVCQSTGSGAKDRYYASEHKSKVIKESKFNESTSYEKDGVPDWFHKTREIAQQEVDETQEKLNEEAREFNRKKLEEAKEAYTDFLAERAWFELGWLKKGLTKKEVWKEKWLKENTTDFSELYEEIRNQGVEMEELEQ